MANRSGHDMLRETDQALYPSFCQKNVYQICYEDEYEANDIDAISFIPPRLVVRIVAELAIGLLVPSTPLPLDTVINHAVFYVLVDE